MTTPRELIIEALKKGPATLSELADMLPVLDRDTVRDAARHASEAGLVSKRIDESNQPLYTLTPEGKAWVPHQGGKGKKRDKPATVAAQVPSDLMNTIIKFCDWVNTEFSTGKRYPINLEECRQVLATWRDDLLDDLESSRAQARQYIASDERRKGMNEQHAPDPMGYAIFRDGLQVGVERSLAVAKHWVEAEIFPLYGIPPDAQQRIAELEERRCEVCGYAEHHREHTGCLRVKVKELEKRRDELLAFAEEVRRSGDSRLASMAIAVISGVKGNPA